MYFDEDEDETDMFNPNAALRESPGCWRDDPWGMPAWEPEQPAGGPPEIALGGALVGMALSLVVTVIMGFIGAGVVLAGIINRRREGKEEKET